MPPAELPHVSFRCKHPYSHLHRRAFEALKVIPIGKLSHDDLEWLTHPDGLRNWNSSKSTLGLVVVFGSGFATADRISSTNAGLKAIETNSPGALLDPSVGLPLGINAQGPPGKASLKD